MFLNLCKFRNLNPWTNGAYLIKYGDNTPAQIVVGKETFTERAAANPNCEGHNSGIVIIYKDKDGIIHKKEEPGIVIEGQKLVGGWCEVFVKDKKPTKVYASLKEYSKPGKNGKLTTWDTMPETMIEKIAIVKGLRKCFPMDLAGLYIQEEMDQANNEDEKPIKPTETTTPLPTYSSRAKKEELNFD
jgi:phage recombination protein Bet